MEEKRIYGVKQIDPARTGDEDLCRFVSHGLSRQEADAPATIGGTASRISLLYHRKRTPLPLSN